MNQWELFEIDYWPRVDDAWRKAQAVSGKLDRAFLDRLYAELGMCL